MILTGTRVLIQRGTIAERRRGWQQGLDAEVASLLRHEPLDDEQLRQRLIDRFRLDPIRLGEIGGSDDGFQPADVHRDFQPFYAFTRQLLYTGSPTLWKQLPYRGYTTIIRLKLSMTGEAFLTGYCAAQDRGRVDHWVRCVRGDLQTSHFHMRPLIDSHNADLTIAVTRHIAAHKAHIERQRQELHTH